MEYRTGFSVVIATHNRYDLLIDAVQSAVEQTLPPLEICIADDGSAEPVEAKWGVQHPVGSKIPIRFVRTSNLGPSAARNAAAKLASGRLLAFLDDDDQWASCYLERSWQCMKGGDVDLLITWMTAFDGKCCWPGKHFPVNFCGHDLYARNLGIVGSNVIAKREAFWAVGGFDEVLLASEDKDFLIRMKQSDARIAVQPEELVRYRVHDQSQISGSTNFHWFQVSGKIEFLRIHAKDMSAETYRQLRAQAALFQLMGGRGVRMRLLGFVTLVRHAPRQLLKAIRLSLQRK